MNKKEIINNMLAYSDILLNKDNIFGLNKDQIIFDFFLEIFKIDISTTSFSELRNYIVDFFAYTKIDFPSGKEEFYNYFFETIIGLYNTPQKECLKVKSAIDDTLALIDNVKTYNLESERKLIKERADFYERIRLINGEITNNRKRFLDYNHLIEEKKLITHELLPTIKSKIDECNYYHKLVEEEEIKIKSLDIKSIALIKAKESNSNYKYQFSYIQENKNYYKTGYDYSITIKFTKELFHLISTYKKNYDNNKEQADSTLANYKFSSDKLIKLKNENINEYKEVLYKYIEEYKVSEYIKTNTKNNHVLYKRYSVIKSALDAFTNRDYLAFMNLIPIQIEGIFFDMCDEFEIIPDELSSYSLISKVNEIGIRVPTYDEKPYFLFHFPLIRNRVAHGLFLQSEKIELLSFEMLLDLQYLVYVMNEKEYLPYFEPLNFVRTFKEKKSSVFLEKIYKTSFENIQLFKWLNSGYYEKKLKWILNPSYNKVFEFYESEDLIGGIKEIRYLIQSDNFLNFVKEQYIKEKEKDVYYPNQSKKMLKKWEKILTLLLIYLKEYKVENREFIINFKRELNLA